MFGVSALEKVNCPGCDASKATDFISSNGYQIVKCVNCELLYVSMRMKACELSRYFSDFYITDNARAQRDFVSIREVSLRRESRIIKSLYPGGARILDVGSATGAFLNHFSGDASWRAEGVEPSRLAAEYARTKFGLNIHNGFLKEAELETGSFDVITSLDSFPLHPNPDEDVAEIFRLLKPGGRFAIEIPGLKFRLMKNTGPVCRVLYGKPVSLNAGIHLCYYSRKTLSLLMAKHGFTLESCHPEQSPLLKSPFLRFLNHAYFYATATLYKLSSGKIDLVSKEFLIYLKNV